MEKILEDINQWLPKIKSLAQRFENSVASKEDLIQEGIIAIIESMKKFNPAKGKKEPFLYTCLSNKIKQVAFENSFAVHVPSGNIMRSTNFNFCKNHSMEDSPIEDTNLVQIEWFDYIESIDREKIGKMYMFDGMNLKEICQLTNLSPSAVSRHINKVRKIVKRELLI